MHHAKMKSRQVSSAASGIPLRRAVDTVLLALWVFGYQAIITIFGALQKVEKLLAAGSKSK
jgi:hypothetical protein